MSVVCQQAKQMSISLEVAAKRLNESKECLVILLMLDFVYKRKSVIRDSGNVM